MQRKRHPSLEARRGARKVLVRSRCCSLAALCLFLCLFPCLFVCLLSFRFTPVHTFYYILVDNTELSTLEIARRHVTHQPRTQQARRHCTWCARIEWHCFRQCKKTQATITSSRVCSGVMKHCHDRGRDQGRSRPSAALHVVCTNRVALLQRLLCWPTV